ncbi:MAG: hypothetical protein H7293_19525 [Candidatus Saccharibacteria bacterium]|nr:hypothetical protein [Rhodoferax sp.]
MESGASPALSTASKATFNQILAPVPVLMPLMAGAKCKPSGLTKRRMGVALAFDADVEVAKTRAKLAASKVKPRAV